MREILQQIISLSSPSDLVKFFNGVRPNILVSNIWYRPPNYPDNLDYPIMEVRYPIEEDVILGAKSQAK